MARAPDEKIEQAKAMYRKGMKLVDVRNAKANVRNAKRVLSRGTKTQLVPPEIRTLRSMGFSASISLKRPGRFFQPLNRQIPSIFFGIRFSLLMPLLSGHSELLTSKISKTKQSSALRRSLEM